MKSPLSPLSPLSPISPLSPGEAVSPDSVVYAECDADVEEALVAAGEDPTIEYIVLLPGEYDVYDPAHWDDDTLSLPVEGGRDVTLTTALQ